eukprot:s971_g1.t1
MHPHEAITFDVELPEGRREGGRTRDGQVFSWQGQLVCSRGCPHFEGTARSRVSDLAYEWCPASYGSFRNEGHQYSFVFGPPSVGKVSRQAAEEETFSLGQSGEHHEGQAPAGEGDSGQMCFPREEAFSFLQLGRRDIPEGSGDEVPSAEPSLPSLPPQERSPTTRPAAASGDTTERSVRSRLTESPGARSTRSFPLLVPPPLRRARVTDRGPYPVRAPPAQISREGDAQKNATGQEESTRQVRHQALSSALELEEWS